jgi:hypothetical protein
MDFFDIFSQFRAEDAKRQAAYQQAALAAHIRNQNERSSRPQSAEYAEWKDVEPQRALTAPTRLLSAPGA